MGDCHGSMGDGESSCTGIEVSLDGDFKCVRSAVPFDHFLFVENLGMAPASQLLHSPVLAGSVSFHAALSLLFHDFRTVSCPALALPAKAPKQKVHGALT